MEKQYLVYHNIRSTFSLYSNKRKLNTISQYSDVCNIYCTNRVHTDVCPCLQYKYYYNHDDDSMKMTQITHIIFRVCMYVVLGIMQYKLPCKIIKYHYVSISNSRLFFGQNSLDYRKKTRGTFYRMRY